MTATRSYGAPNQTSSIIASPGNGITNTETENGKVIYTNSIGDLGYTILTAE